MAHFSYREAEFTKLKDTVLVISGAATGIGAATAKILAANGAKVVIGDINSEAGRKLSDELEGSIFVQCDVTKYDDIYNLFDTAYKKFGRIDHAVSSAGIYEQGNWFDPGLTIGNVKDDSGNLKTLEVNAIGTLQFARVAAVFLRHDHQEGQDRTLTLLSSVNAFRESPGLFLYQTGKHAIQGLLRSSRKMLWERDHIRVNAVCPGVTDTPMVANVIENFKSAGLWTQPAEAVAKIIAGIQCDTSLIGKAYYIEGGDGWEFEDSFYSCQPQWLGEEPTRRMRMNAEAVQKGALIPK